MLAHLAHADLSRTWRLALTLGLAAAAFGLARSAFAADLLPPGALDASATGRISDGLIAPTGDMSATLRLDDTSGVANGSELGTIGSGSAAPLSRADQASLLLGVGLARRLELTLGLHGTAESGSAAARDGLAPAGAPAAQQAGAFSGASLFVKAQLVEAGGFQLALAPFAETGAGDAAEAALTRAAKPRAGFMGILAYGSPDVATVSLNGGLRYRDPETIGTVTLRNEQFYQAGVKTKATREWTLFADYSGRRLQVADATAATPGYEFRTSAQVEAGVGVKLGDADLQAYAAKSVQGADFGFGDRSFGLSLGYMVGNVMGERRPRHSFADEVVPTKAPDVQTRAEEAPKKEPEKADAGIPIGTQVDPYEAVRGDAPADFNEAEAYAAKYRKDTETESEDARIERELKAIQEAEVKEEAERAKIEAAETAKRQAAARAQAKENEKLEREYQEEAKKSAAKLQGITDDEMGWDGLQ